MKWRKFFKESHKYSCVKNDDTCVYAREYISEGYTAGSTNSLISNFKKSPTKQKAREWHYRQEAVKQFKDEIESLFLGIESSIKKKLKITITAIPSSKAKDHPEYDYRFEDLFTELLKTRSDLNVEWPVGTKKTIQASHHGGEREIKRFMNNYVWQGFKKTPEVLWVVDDVLTSGSQFRAISNFLINNNYNGEIIGVFWARTV